MMLIVEDWGTSVECNRNSTMRRRLIRFVHGVRLLPFLRFACISLGIFGFLRMNAVYGAEATASAKLYEVQVIKDITYCEGAEADKAKHKLDLFLPKDKKAFPVLFFVHGGGWRTGDKSFLGVYSALGMLFAKHGIGTVVINYR